MPCTKTHGRFDSIDKHFDRAADFQTPRISDKQQLSTEIGGGNQKGKKRPRQPSVRTPSGGELGSGSGSGSGSGLGSGSGSGLGSGLGLELCTGTRGGSGSGSGSKRPPAPWVSTLERQRGREPGVCLRCGANGHVAFAFTKYFRSPNPEQNKPRNQHQPTLPMTVKSSASHHLTTSSKKTSLPHPVPGSATEVGRDGAGNAGLWHMGLDGNGGGDTTLLTSTQTEDCFREPESLHVYSISLRHGDRQFATHNPRSYDTRSTRNNAARTSCYRPRRNEHFYSPKTSSKTGSTARSCTYNHPLPQRTGHGA